MNLTFWLGIGIGVGVGTLVVACIFFWVIGKVVGDTAQKNREMGDMAREQTERLIECWQDNIILQGRIATANERTADAYEKAVVILEKQDAASSKS